MSCNTKINAELSSLVTKPIFSSKRGASILSRSLSAPSATGKPFITRLYLNSSTVQSDHKNLSSPTCVGVDAHAEMRECTPESLNGESAFRVKPHFPSSRASSNSSASRRSDPCSAPDSPPSVEDASPYKHRAHHSSIDESAKLPAPADSSNTKSQYSSAEPEKSRWFPSPVWIPPPASSSSSIPTASLPPPASPDMRPSYPNSRAITPHSVVSAPHAHVVSSTQPNPLAERIRSRARTSSTVSLADDGWDALSHVSTHSIYQSNQIPNYSFASDDFYAYPQPASKVYTSFWTFKRKKRDLEFFWNPESMLRTCLSFVWWIGAINLHQAATRRLFTWGTTIHPNFVMEPPLHDYIHEAVPSLQTFRVVPEILHSLPIVIFALSMIKGLDSQALDAFRTFMCCHGCLMLLRAISFSSTLLPDASRQCMTSFYVGSCFDLIFSGHAMIMSLSMSAIFHFYPYLLTPMKKALLLFHATCVGFLIVAVRNHYTIDVVIGVLLAPLFLRLWVTSPFLSSLSMTNSPFQLRDRVFPRHRAIPAMYIHKPTYLTRSRGNSTVIAPTPLSNLPGQRRKESMFFTPTPASSYPNSNAATPYTGTPYASPSFRPRSTDEYSLYSNSSAAAAGSEERPSSKISSLLYHLRNRRVKLKPPFMTNVFNSIVPMAAVDEACSASSSPSVSPQASGANTISPNPEAEVTLTSSSTSDSPCTVIDAARPRSVAHKDEQSSGADTADNVEEEATRAPLRYKNPKESQEGNAESDAATTGFFAAEEGALEDGRRPSCLTEADADDLDGSGSYGNSDADSDPRSIPSSLLQRP